MYWLDSLEVIGMCYSPPSSNVGQEFNLQPFSSTLTETNLGLVQTSIFTCTKPNCNLGRLEWLRAAVDSNVYTNLPILIDSNVNLYMYLIETLGSVHVKIDVWTRPYFLILAWHIEKEILFTPVLMKLLDIFISTQVNNC